MVSEIVMKFYQGHKVYEGQFVTLLILLLLVRALWLVITDGYSAIYGNV